MDGPFGYGGTAGIVEGCVFDELVHDVGDAGFHHMTLQFRDHGGAGAEEIIPCRAG